MLKFGYSEWVMEHIVVFGITILPLTFYFLYKILLLKESRMFKAVGIVGVFLTMFIVVPSMLFVFLVEGHIQDYREDFKAYVESTGRYTLKIEDVRITNNEGNHIPKFSAKDEHEYVTIEYTQKGKRYKEVVKSEPYKVDGDEYKVSFVYVDQDYLIEYGKYSKFLMGIRKALGYKDDYKLNFEKGAYDFSLGVPDDEYEKVKSEMSRKAK